VGNGSLSPASCVFPGRGSETVLAYEACGCAVHFDGSRKPQRHVVRRACRPRGEAISTSWEIGVGKGRTRPHFRVIVIFCGEWGDGDGLSQAFCDPTACERPTRSFGCDRCRAWPIWHSFWSLSARSLATRSSQRTSTDALRAGLVAARRHRPRSRPLLWSACRPYSPASSILTSNSSTGPARLSVSLHALGVEARPDGSESVRACATTSASRASARRWPTHSPTPWPTRPACLSWPAQPWRLWWPRAEDPRRHGPGLSRRAAQ
jgi:hypothetical protein